MSGAFQKTIEDAIAHAMRISTPDKKGWFICYTCIDQPYFCLSIYALSAWAHIEGWIILGVLRPDGRYKLRHGWAKMVITARLTA